jgi:hypothetical protein
VKGPLPKKSNRPSLRRSSAAESGSPVGVGHDTRRGERQHLTQAGDRVLHRHLGDESFVHVRMRARVGLKQVAGIGADFDCGDLPFSFVLLTRERQLVELPRPAMKQYIGFPDGHTVPKALVNEAMAAFLTSGNIGGLRIESR